VIENNTICSNSLEWGTSNGLPLGGMSIFSVNSIISNNICKGNIYIDRNNLTGIYDNGNNTLSKNSTNLGDNFASQFIGGITTDKYYMLKPTSTAKGAGTGGIDCGAFGGSDPYVLSGLPAIPHIYDVVAPTSGSATSGLAIKVKVKTQK
jgi:hypothetical protein